MTALHRINRRAFLSRSALAAAALASSLAPRLAAQPKPGAATGKPIPVILATDIGDDIDDTWALGFLLKSPELDLKLAVTDYGKADYRARLLAKFLQGAGRSNVDVGMGTDIEPRGEGGQAAWVKDYDLKTYPGKVHKDGVQAMVDVIMNSETPVTVIAIGPPPTVAAALAREPRIASRARFVGMYGSVRLGYGGSKTPAAEWNVKAVPKAAQQILSAPWDIRITPLDTCGLVTLEGERYRQLLESRDPIVMNILENYRIWSRSNKNQDAERRSSVLFDTVAVYLAIGQDLCKMEELRIRVTDDGFTKIDPSGKSMLVATSWKTLDDYRDLLVERLKSKG